MKNIRRITVLAVQAILVCMMVSCSSAGKEADSQGMSYFKEEKYAEALASFEEAAGADPADGMYQVHCGMVYIRLEQYEEAQEAFGKALQADSDLREAYRGRGICFLKQGQYAEAAAEFEKVLELTGIFPDETDYDSLHWLGEAYYRAGEYDKCADVVIRLLKLEELSAEDGALVNELALQLMEQGSNDLAGELLDEAIERLNGDFLQALQWNRIILAEQTQEYAKAKAMLDVYCTAYPTDADGALEQAALKNIVTDEPKVPDTSQTSDGESGESK